MIVTRQEEEGRAVEIKHGTRPWKRPVGRDAARQIGAGKREARPVVGAPEAQAVVMGRPGTSSETARRRCEAVEREGRREQVAYGSWAAPIEAWPDQDRGVV